ncbi:hypothetical protein HAX54_025091 [Datura stramonium]|uniref:Uncharacterized protein n=1 Tax=Datura stramonium TaxID=4076 RepID=A0ABS8UZQ0_DATST|nr:hypothetical protein [Datura stramonium]
MEEGGELFGVVFVGTRAEGLPKVAAKSGRLGRVSVYEGLPELVGEDVTPRSEWGILWRTILVGGWIEPAIEGLEEGCGVGTGDGERGTWPTYPNTVGVGSSLKSRRASQACPVRKVASGEGAHGPSGAMFELRAEM